MTRLAWVDRAKGLAILLVVLHHVIQFSADQPWASDGVIYANTMLQTVRMPLFFAMSGLFFQRSAAQPWRWLFVNRVLPFAYLYVLWTVIWHASFEAMPVERAGFGFRFLAAHFLDMSVGPWYLYALALYFVVAKILSPLPPWSQLAIAAAVSVPIATRLVEVHWWAWEFTGMYGLAFFAGMHGRHLLVRLADQTTWVTVVIAAAVWASGTAAVHFLGLPHGRYLFVPLCGAGIALGVTLAAFWSRASVLGWFGRRTLPIYLLHQPLIGAVYSTEVIRSLPSSPWVTAGVLLCTWTAVVTASIAIWHVAKVIPGVFVAPWYGSGNATMTRVENRAPLPNPVGERP